MQRLFLIDPLLAWMLPHIELRSLLGSPEKGRLYKQVFNKMGPGSLTVAGIRLHKKQSRCYNYCFTLFNLLAIIAQP